LHFESGAVRDELVKLLQEARSFLKGGSVWRKKKLPLPQPSFTVAVLSVRPLWPWSALEVVLAREMQFRRDRAIVWPLHANTPVLITLATPLGTQLVSLKGAQLLESAAADGLLTLEQACDNVAAGEPCTVKLALQLRIADWVKPGAVAPDGSESSWQDGALLFGLLAMACVVWGHGPGGDVKAMWMSPLSGASGALCMLVAVVLAPTAAPAGRSLLTWLKGKLGVRCVTVCCVGGDIMADDEEEQIPDRFILSCPGDLKEAQRRWHLSKSWKKQNDIANILQKRQPYFRTLKEAYPQYYHKRDKEGRPVVIESITSLKKTVKEIHDAGISMDQVLLHSAFVTEYLWQVIDSSELPGGKMTRIIDVQGVSIFDLSAEVLHFLREVGNMYGVNYPERQHKIFVVNVPAYFSVLWKLVRPLVRPITVEKTQILQAHQVREELLAVIPAENLPVEYGGTCVCEGAGGCSHNAPEDRSLQAYVASLNDRRASGDETPIPLPPPPSAYSTIHVQ
ncbi:hypothetical protein CYMTET_17446, partial [Cymbomonas tetramitiformis]